MEKVVLGALNSRVTENVYNDLLQPAAKELGGNLETLAKTITLILSPLKSVVWSFDQIVSWLSLEVAERLSGHSGEGVKAPPVEVAGPLLMNFPFVQNIEGLRELYANLLASAMTVEATPKVHVSYVHIIQQLSPDEAQVLSFLRAKNLKGDEAIAEEIIHLSGENPDSLSIESQFLEICKHAQVSSLESSDLYLNNLCRLGLLRLREWTNAEVRDRTLDWVDNPSEVEFKVVQSHTIYLSISEFGHGFLEVCVSWVNFTIVSTEC